MAINQARTTSRLEALAIRKGKKHNRVPFVLNHNPLNPPIYEWLRSAHDHISLSEKMTKVMPEPPIVGLRNPRNLRNILMPSSLPPVKPTLPRGVHKCHKKCVISLTHLVATSSIVSSVTEESFYIKDSVSCESENIIYLLFCAKCPNSQYVGETQNSLRNRFYLHRSHISRNTGKCTHVNAHFNSPNHSLRDLRCLPIEKIKSLSKPLRKAREQHWIKTLKTIFPSGLNAYEK